MPGHCISLVVLYRACTASQPSRGADAAGVLTSWRWTKRSAAEVNASERNCRARLGLLAEDPNAGGSAGEVADSASRHRVEQGHPRPQAVDSLDGLASPLGLAPGRRIARRDRYHPHPGQGRSRNGRQGPAGNEVDDRQDGKVVAGFRLSWRRLRGLTPPLRRWTARRALIPLAEEVSLDRRNWWGWLGEHAAGRLVVRRVVSARTVSGCQRRGDGLRPLWDPATLRCGATLGPFAKCGCGGVRAGQQNARFGWRRYDAAALDVSGTEHQGGAPCCRRNMNRQWGQ